MRIDAGPIGSNAIITHVGEMLHGPGGGCVPAVSFESGVFYPAVLPVGQGHGVVMDRAVPWACPETALRAAERMSREFVGV